MRYAVVFERASDGGYCAYIPDLPGCAALGGTLEETRRLIKEAVELHLKTMRADGDPIPEPTTVSDYVETPEAIHAV